jgi:hypothetical protein
MMWRFLFFVFGSFLFSCSNKKAEETPPAPPPPQYYFFPKANVYFDTVNRDYVFMSGDGRTWTTSKEIPAAMQDMMDKSVFLDSFSQPVWKENQNHRLIYAAKLYASPEDTVEQKPAPVVQAPPPGDGSTKKEKKGIRKFFDKLFGKKKKD